MKKARSNTTMIEQTHNQVPQEPTTDSTVAASLRTLTLCLDQLLNRESEETITYDGDEPAAHFFSQLESQPNFHNLEPARQARKALSSLRGEPRKIAQDLALLNKTYEEVKESLCAVYPRRPSFTLQDFYELKCTSMAEIETYYKNKVRIGLAINLPKSAIVQALSNGVPPLKLPNNDHRARAEHLPPPWTRPHHILAVTVADNTGTHSVSSEGPTSGLFGPLHLRSTASSNPKDRLGLQVSTRPQQRRAREKPSNANFGSRTPPKLNEPTCTLNQHTPVISLRPYRTPYAYQKEIQDQISQLLKHDIITPSSSPYSSPVALVRKRDNTMRLCIDFRRVNELVPSDLHPLPLIETVLDNLYKFVIYSDHHALQRLKTIKDPTGRLFRWSLRLSAYDYEVKYLKDSRQYEADLLSRNPFCGFLSTGQIKDHQGELRRDTRYILNDKDLMTIIRRGVTKIIVPPSLRGTLLQRAHRDFNHPGISQMTRLIAAQYYWDGMTNDIRTHVRTCSVCQLVKPPKGPIYGELGQLPPAILPYELVSLDTISGFAKYGNSQTFLLVVVDHATRYAWAFSSRSTSILTYTQVIKKVMQFGSPKRLLTDRAPAFTSPKFRRFLIRHNIGQLLTTSNNPQANGLSERLNATITGKLKLLRLQQPKTAWTKLLPQVLQAYNHTPHSVTGHLNDNQRDCHVQADCLDPSVLSKIRSIFSKAFLSSNPLPFIFKTPSRVLVIPHCMLNFPLKRLRFQQSSPFSSINKKFRNDIVTDGLSRQDIMEIGQDTIGVKTDNLTKERGENGSQSRENEPTGERQEVREGNEQETSPLVDVIQQFAAALAQSRSCDPTGPTISPFDGTYSAIQFFQAFDRKMEDASMGEQEKLLRLPNYLVRQPLELFRKLRLADRSYFQVRQILLDLYPESSEASFAKYFAMKLTGQANLETYYREKTAMGLQLGLPQEVILETLTEGLPFSDQRLVRVVPPENLGEWTNRPQCRVRITAHPDAQVHGMHLFRRPTVSSAARGTGTANAGIDQSRRPTKKNGQCNQSHQTDTKAFGQCKQSQNNQSRVPSNQVKPETPQQSRLFETERDKTKRFCIDYRKVNELISSDVHPLPRIEDILDRLAQAKYFSTADISSAYWQVPIHPDSRPLLAFATLEGLYQPTRLPFGLKTSPQIYERAISQVLQRHGLDCVAHYFDDFIIYSNTLEEHQNHLRQFFAFCEAEKLQLNFAKCEFFKQSIDFLGYTITAGTTTPLTRNTDIIHAIKQPHNRKTLQSFLGAVNVYNKFIPEYARLRAPLNNLLKKDVVWNWNEVCQKAFIDLKGNLTQHPILHLYKEGLPCQVYCDASTLGIAGILKQVHPDGNIYPVQYFSRTLRPHEKNYSISELECLAIVESVEKFRIYLMDRKFTIFSDHHALQWLKTIKNPSGRLFRWSLRLSSYEYEVRYIKGKQQYEADLLSRNPFCGFLDATLIKTHQPPPSRESSLTIDRNGLHTVSRKGVTKIIIPKPFIQQLLQTVHTQYNHPGISQMSRLISTQYYWQGMSKDIKQKVKTCPTCQLTKRPLGPTYGELSQPPEAKEPFDLLSLDTIAGFAKYGNTRIYLHVVVDHFSRYAWTFPSKSTSITTYQQVLKRVLQDGSPKRLLTDRAPAFTSPKFRSFLLNRNIHPLLTTSNNPQANGLCERLNATLTGKLRLYRQS
ncbi:hypothetical protein LAZ67_13002472 [Cordylochernes scorpioides]|uniref:RNA-directed DNA polymerase n=1 Tax=Cordylochernes scorpioides TaxID=51811 RepID=A0ABY6L8K1_9ARAC|nr:hypothetical protein LAZ67_13002472 [Cordylochernes scorpioides]